MRCNETLLTCLKNFIRRNLNVLGEDEIDDRLLSAFTKHRKALSIKMLLVLSICAIVLLIAAWPTDFWLFKENAQVLRLLAFWRINIIVACFLMVIGFKKISYLKENPELLGAVIFLYLFCISGFVAGEGGGIESPFFYGIYTAAIINIVIVSGLSFRVLSTTAYIVAYLACFALLHREHLDHPQIVTPIVWLFFSIIIYSIAGHVMFLLIRKNFIQRMILDERARELEELNCIKNDFFANISHELRTPLTVIIGGLRSVQPVIKDEKLSDLLTGSISNASRLTSLIDDLLQLARFDSGRSATQKIDVNLLKLIEQVAANFKSDNWDRIKVLHSDSPEKYMVAVDPRQITTAIYNLIGNAIKYSDPETGQVHINITPRENEITIEVKDNGIGIPVDRQEKIFDRFYRVEANSYNSRQGSGIGLALVREIVVNHGGRIEVESKIGEGAIFRIELPRGELTGKTYNLTSALPLSSKADIPVPVRADAEVEIPKSKPASGAKRHLILVVEDNRELRNYITMLLDKYYRVIEAVNGKEGLKIAREFEPDLILTDLMMPEMSGDELLKCVRADKQIRDIPMIFLTARTGVESKTEALRMGAQDYLTKPFEESELFVRIDNQLKLRDMTQNLRSLVDEQTKELKLLAENLAAIQESERRRLARDIHDDLGQILTRLGFEIDLMEMRLKRSTPDEDAEASLESIRFVMHQIHESTRRIISTLRPDMLDELGFSAAVRHLADNLLTRCGIDVTIELDFEEDMLFDGQSIELFRIVQESLTNISRHAGAQTVKMSILQTESALKIEIIDDGIGFDSGSPSFQKGVGLLSIKERARLLLGRSEITSRINEGTTIIIEAPMASESVQ
jgi:signal transduction histidine kinase